LHAMISLFRRVAPCALLLCSAVALHPHEPRPSFLAVSSRKINASAKAIITLGQSLNHDGSPSRVLVKRAEEAAAAYRELGGVPVIVSGGDPINAGVTEAEVMHRLLSQARGGVPNASILMEPKALTTVQNAVYTGALLNKIGAKEAVLVTSDFHMPRALYTFEAVLKNISITPRIAKGGCAKRDAEDDAAINKESLVQRLQEEIDIISEQMPMDFLPTALSDDVKVPSPGHDRLEVALNEAKALLIAAKQLL